MAITIITPKPVPRRHHVEEDEDSGSDSDSSGGVDLQGDVKMRPAKQARRDGNDGNDGGGGGGGGGDEIVTPGEVITDDPQWMRGHGTHTAIRPSTGEAPAIISSVAGTVTRTNKLLSVRPLRARYVPEVGDLVVGRVVEVQARRWRVDVGAAQLASLPLSAINLPGGVLRKRTETDELQIRSFFAEGDLAVAEVQQVYADGAAVLHTRSLRYGKLRNGLFVAVSGGGRGAGAGVVRARRQVWTADAARGAGRLDVVLGVNGYVWVCKHVDGESAADAADAVSITRMEESVNMNTYSSQNDHVGADLMREMARLRGVILALVEHGLRVDEEMIMKGYHEAVGMAQQDVEDNIYLGGERGQQLVAMLTA